MPAKRTTDTRMTAFFMAFPSLFKLDDPVPRIAKTIYYRSISAVNMRMIVTVEIEDRPQAREKKKAANADKNRRENTSHPWGFVLN